MIQAGPNRTGKSAGTQTTGRKANMGQNIKAVFTDVDGTLLNSAHRVTPRTGEWIHRILQRGIHFVIVSARSPSGIYPIMRRNDLHCALISYSGAMIMDEDRNVLYSRCTELIYTEDMRERKRVMEELSDAFVVMPGGFGTMEEFFEVLTAKTLGLHMKPIALVNTKGVWDELETFSKRLLSEGFISESCIGSYRICPDPAEALDFVMNDPDKDKEPKWVKYVVKEEDILK